MASQEEIPQQAPPESAVTEPVLPEPVLPETSWWKRHWELGAFVGLVIVAAVMRFWQLDLRPIHHDESLHALYSYYYAIGKGFQQNPMMHGPFQFHASAFFMFFFGDSNYVARMASATFSSALVFIPYFFRQHLGKLGAILVSLMLAVSPSFLFFGRFTRSDNYVLVFNLVLVTCLWRYIAEKKPVYLYVGSAALSLAFATKETTFITVAIFGLFLLTLTAGDWLKAVRNGFKFSSLPPAAVCLLLLGTFTLPQLAAFSGLLQKRIGVTLLNSDAGAGPIGTPVDPRGYAVAAVVFLVLLGISVAVGLRWNRRQWLICAGIFWGIYVVLYSSVFTNFLGVASGLWQSLGYWLVQQEVKRGGQPFFYYLVLLPTYEFLPLIFAAIGGVYHLIKKDVFTFFLMYWAAMSLIAYSYAGEKMPWLVVHITMPMILLAGKFLGSFFERKLWNPVNYLLLASFAFLLVFTVETSAQAAYRTSDRPVELLDYAQGSFDLKNLMSEIEEVAQRTGAGKDLKIVVDTTDGLSWPLSWYFHDYKNVSYPDLSNISSPPDAAVVLLGGSNAEKARPHLQDFGEGHPFRNLIWFAEDYRSLSKDNVLKPSTWHKYWRYFVYRETPHDYWNSQGIAYFPKDFSFSK